MIDELTYAQQMLTRGGYTLVICSGGHVHISEEGGLDSLLEISDSTQWEEAVAADKVVGKAAALLFAKLKVSAVYAEVLSKSGARVLESNDIAYRYNKCVGSLLNSEGTDYCPYEKAVKDIADPDEAVIILKK